MGLKPLYENIAIRRLQLPVYSAMRGDIIPNDPAQIFPSVSENMDNAIKIWQTVQKMYDDGFRILIQLGGGDTLYSQVKANISTNDLTAIPMDVDYRPAITQLNHLCATLLTKGVNIDLGFLFRYRSSRELACGPYIEEGCHMPGCYSSYGFNRDSALGSESAALRNAASEESRQNSRSETVCDERRMPFIGSVSAYKPGQEITVEYVLDIKKDLYLIDHMFIHAPGIKPPSACLPIAPMAMELEMMAEVAACLAPGYGIIGFEDVTASRWISLEDIETLPIQISAQVAEYNPDTLSFKIKTTIRTKDQKMPAISGTVLFGKSYLVDIDIKFEEMTNLRHSPLSADKIYGERYFFLGPIFHCLSGTPILSDKGIFSELIVLPKDRLFRSLRNPELLVDPVILDGVAQNLAAFSALQDMQVFPIGFRKLEIYRPTPPVGARLPVCLQVTDLGPRTCYADVEVQDGEGSVWMRMKGWGGWIFRWAKKPLDFRRLPTVYTSCDELQLPFLPEGAVCQAISKSALRDYDLTWMARYYLHMDEMITFNSYSNNPNRRRQWLLGRIAAKDAARVWMAQRTNSEMLHPAAFTINNDPSGQPFVAGVPSRTPVPCISLAHTEDRAVAIAHHERVGIDIEKIAQRQPEFLNAFTTQQERVMLGGVSPLERDAFITSLWCAKEAVGKCMGTGVHRAPQVFEAVDMHGDGKVTIKQRDSSQTYLVNTVRNQDFIIAITSNGCGM
jgi:phosphopantetheine--protein transferase-like protein